jgi:nucleoside-diphosphate-sugar epimerase
MKKKKSILILGGAGYIGTVVVDFFLKKKYKVTCIDNLLYGQKGILKSFKKNKNFIFLNIDLRDRKKIDKVLSQETNILILAGLVGDPITKKYKKLSHSINYIGIKNLILSCRSKKNIKRLVFVSTCSNYGIGEKKLLSEKAKLKPLSYYSKQKVMIEKLLIKMKKTDFTSTILRFATAFGLSPRMRFDLTINHFVKSLSDGETLKIYDPKTSRPYCHVLDFARAINKVFESKTEKVDKEVFNVGDNKNNFSKKKIVEQVSKYISSPKILFLKKGVDKRDYTVDFMKIKKRLNFKTKYSVNFGIKEILNYVEKNKKNKKSLKKLGNFNISGDKL